MLEMFYFFVGIGGKCSVHMWPQGGAKKQLIAFSFMAKKANHKTGIWELEMVRKMAS